MRSVKCKIREWSAKCKVLRVERGVWSAKCGAQSLEVKSAECRVQSVEWGVQRIPMLMLLTVSPAGVEPTAKLLVKGRGVGGGGVK